MERSWQKIAAAAEVHKVQPSRPPDLRGDVLVPLVQAVITAGLIAAVVWMAADGMGVAQPAMAAGVVFLFALVGVWLVLLIDTRGLLRAVEKVTGQDLDGDGQVGPPLRPKPQLVFVNAARSREEAQRRREEVEVEEGRRLLVEFVRQIPARGTGARAWESELGRDLYREFRDGLIKMGWAEWNSYNAQGKPNARKGWRLTVSPEEIIERIT